MAYKEIEKKTYHLPLLQTIQFKKLILSNYTEDIFS